ncbi:putative pentatricopeptide repeat-containing protein [Quercus suber]|uniref:Pentatricopeptide repeat-containing protein n=2 Tax=Quercus suber TaxID=58331 RepID=A0AAW0L7E4_QUESU|nr:putative pentatricopeptide repeat-containing protein [Quercus suber]
MFCEMVRNGVEPDAFTLSSALKGCKSMKALSNGALVHGLAIKNGMKESMYVNNASMDLYATCYVSMDEACMVFHEIDAKNAVSWTTLITGYTHRGDGYGGFQVFGQILLISS